MSNAPVEAVLVSVETFGTKVGIGRSMAWALVRSGEVASVKIGARRLIHQDEIAQFVERLRVEQGAAADEDA